MAPAMSHGSMWLGPFRFQSWLSTSCPVSNGARRERAAAAASMNGTVHTRSTGVPAPTSMMFAMRSVSSTSPANIAPAAPARMP